ncbi:hypothetical protein [Pedobacter sp. L105]|uniref:hypothetical protein n=1 Tax=Pedobacter sp. L105 TaxID=1641871 RepID=UPI001C20C1E5|nr:hypothetical protein [Pedobacter sp. L105]
MHYDFSQHKLFEKRWFKFTDDGLRVRYRSIMKTNEYEIKYEDIGNKIVDFSGGVRAWFIPTLILSIVSGILYIDRINGGDVENGAEFFYLSFALVCLILYIMTFKKARYLSKSNNANAIEFLRKKATEKDLENFINQILSRRKSFLIERYGQLNRNISYESQYNNLKWLLDNNVLDQKSYEEKLADLEELFPATTVIKGFTFGTN